MRGGVLLQMPEKCQKWAFLYNVNKTRGSKTEKIYKYTIKFYLICKWFSVIIIGLDMR